jgi:hypothetical protein
MPMRNALLSTAFAAFLGMSAHAQSVLVLPNSQQATPPEPQNQQQQAERLKTPATSPQSHGPAAGLYVKLRDAGLDAQQVYTIRDAYIDREDLHIKLDDGTIAFGEAVDGHITTAFFEGDGEALLSPPDNVERWSLNVFSGSPILEEQFVSAFLRFNDDTFAGLKQFLRPVEQADAKAFADKWDHTVRQLSAAGALRTATTIINSRHLSADGKLLSEQRDPNDRLFIARVAGRRIGLFDLIFDTDQPEQISVGHLAQVDNLEFYDVWTSFPMRSARQAAAASSKRATIATQASAETAEPDPFRVTKYMMKVHVAPPHTISTDATLDITVRKGGRRVMRFELSRFLKVSEASANSKPIDFLQNEALQGTALARRGDDVVAIVFPQPVSAGQKLSIHIVYSGEVMAEAGGGLMYVGSRGAWYPNRGLAMSDYDMEFTYPREWSLIATGRRVSQGEAANGERVERYVSERPVPLAGFNLGKYVEQQTTLGPTSIATYAAAGVESNFPKQRASVMVMPDIRNRRTGAPEIVTPPAPNPAQHARIITERAARDVDFLSMRLGPYPYSSLSLTQMPGRDSSSWPGLIFLSSYVFLSPEERTEARVNAWGNLLYSDVMQTHETVHQWIGDLIIWRSYREQWIVEALSNEVALLKLEQERPTDAAAVLDHYRAELLSRNRDGVEVTEAGPVTLGVRLDSSRFPDGYEAISYGRGTWLFHMLRHMLLENPEARAKGIKPGPDEPFFQALREIRRKFEGREITTRELQQVFEEYVPDSLKYEGRKSLDWFFDTWVNGTSIPKLELNDVKIATAKSTEREGSRTIATGKITQTNAPDTLVTSVPIYTDGGEFVARVFAEGPETSFKLTVPPGTKRLVLDPHGTVLRRR